MRHRVFGRKLGRDIKRRRALFKNLAISLIINEKITTTLSRAKAAKPLVDSLISKAKKGDLGSRRQTFKVLGHRQAVAKLVDDLAPRFADRTGGFTRIVKLEPRFSDAAPMAILSLVTLKKEEEKTGGEKAKKERKKKSRGTKKNVQKTETKKSKEVKKEKKQ